MILLSRAKLSVLAGLFFFFNLIPFIGSAQEKEGGIPPSDSGSVFLELQSRGFFQNYEYFNKIKEGTTLPGVWLQPMISYRPTQGLNVRAGVHLLNYSGRDTLAKIQPLLSVSMKLRPDIKVILGSFYTLDRHKLEQPLLKEELLYTKAVENGVQMKIEREKLWADFWISWESFILPNDPFQERFLAGISLQIPLFTTNDFSLELPFQQTFYHRGGQNIAIDTTLLTLYNLATGLTCKYKQFGLTIMDMTFKDLSPQKQQAFEKGSALFVKGFYNTKGVTLNLGYWHGHKFMSAKGEELFMSAIPEVNTITYPTIEVIFGKCTVLREIKGVGRLGFEAGVFQNLALHGLDYYYGLTISLGQEFFLGKVRATPLPTK
ncbi:hypothetical protein [Williamwhitmania taraxaci]|uniref:Uncharacterized protein n=1 Tax=Williamwhitmania taraxaci TaxID=1640674 RepID=A0A1G6QHL2_9BACT|nr:hypothetical protein [Williamwhitmania taraxaci]SDC91414.1 hypothetical protein SAMN05216323_10614 [Williamwhitmania taraxaci]